MKLYSGMKQLFPLLLLLLSGVAAHGQIVGKSVPEFTTAKGTLFHKGDTVRMGLGTDMGGRFKYAETPANIMGTPRIPFTAYYANTRLVIKDLRTQSSKRAGSRTVAVVNASGGLNAAIDLNAAEEAGEIHTVHNQQPASISTATAAPSVADELLKLKKLLDGGIITQQEFDAQKSKLLSK